MATRCEPTPMAMPKLCAAAARLRFTLRARSKPPVIEEIRIGACSRLPRNVVLEIDLIDVELRQRVVDEAIAVQARARCARDALGIEADFEMLFFAFLGFGEGFVDPAAWHVARSDREITAAFSLPCVLWPR